MRAAITLSLAASTLSQSAYLNLTAGVPFSAAVTRGNEIFFRLPAPFNYGLSRCVAVLSSTSGSCDLLATAGYFYDPKPSAAEWFGAAAFGEAIIVIPNNSSFTDQGAQCHGASWSSNAQCPFNFGVFGSRGCNFTLTASLPGVETNLIPGVSFAGSLARGGAADLYNVSLAGNESSLTLRVVPAAGAVGLRLQLGSSPASVCASANESPGFGVIVLSITSASPCFAAAAAAGGALVASVSAAEGGGAGDADAVYSVVLTTSDEPLALLVDGVPSVGGGPYGWVDGFSFSVPAGLPAGASVRVSIVPSWGGVALYGALGPVAGPAGPALRGPAEGRSDFSAVARVAGPVGPALPGPAGGRSDFSAVAPSSGTPFSLTIASSASAWAAAGCDAGCTLLLGAYTLTPSSSYEVVASAAQWTWLTSALPALGSIAPAAPARALFAFASTAAGAGAAPLVFSVEATAGRAILAVVCASANATDALHPDPSNNSTYYWWAGGEGDVAVEVVIMPDDPAACALPAVYVLGVVSGDATRGVVFSVIARVIASDGAPMPISLNEPIADAVASRASPGNLYILALDGSADVVTITATAAAGDGATVPPLALFGGVSAAALNFSSSADARVQYLAESTGFGADQTFVVRQTDPGYNVSGCNVVGTGLCFLTVGVTGLAASPTRTQAFALNAAADVRTLTDGIPLTARVEAAPATARFTFVAADASPFYLVLTMLGGSQDAAPDLFLACGYVPNATTYGWESHATGGDLIRVTWREPFNNPASVSFPARFEIVVAGWTTPASFSLLYKSVSYAVLAPGVPQSLLAPAGALAYALFRVPPPSTDGGVIVGFELSTAPLSGDPAPAVWVNVAQQSIRCPHCGYPECTTTPCDAQSVSNIYPPWSSEGSVDARAISVAPEDVYFQPGALYVIAILAAVDSEVTVTATATDGIALLSDGVPLPWAMSGGAADTYSWFYLSIVSRDVDLLVAVTPDAGSVDVFVSVNSKNSRPTANAFDKAAFGGVAGGGGLAVSFAWSELPECPDSSFANAISCAAWIAVRVRGGTGGANFYAVGEAAKPNASSIQLFPGVPQTGLLAASDTAYFYALISVAPSVEYSLLLNPHGTSKAYMYATTDGSRPSSTNPAARATTGSNGPRAIVFAPTDASGYNESCLLRVAVEVPWIPSGGFVHFDVTLALGTNGITELLSGVPARIELQVQHTRYFTFTLGDSPTDASSRGGVQFYLSSSSGPFLGPSIALGVAAPAGNASFFPGPGGAASCATAAGDTARAWSRLVDPSGVTSCACASSTAPGCRYVLAVSCPGIPLAMPPCILSVAATLGAPAPLALSDGVALREPAPLLGIPALFFFDVGSALAAGGNVTVSALATGGSSVRILGLASSVWMIPEAGSANYDSNLAGPPGPLASISVASTDAALAGCPGGCSLLCVALEGDGGGGTVSVVAAVSSGFPNVLTLGIAAPVALGLYRQVFRYALWLSDPTADLVVTVTALTGTLAFTLDAGVGKDCSIARPSNVVTCGGTWASTDGSALVVSAADPCANANAAAALPCDASRDWSTHGGSPYILSVLVTLSPTSFSALAAQPGAAIALVFGEPETSTATATSPALFLATVNGDGSDLRLLASAGATDLAWIAAGGGAAGGGGPSASGTLPAHSAITIPPLSWCPSADSCAVYFTFSAPSCAGIPLCAAPVTALARSGGGIAPIDIPWGDVSSQAVALGGDSPMSLFQIFLPGIANALVDVSLVLDACGSGAGAPPLSLFFCDPTAPIGAGRCAAPYSPDAGDSTGSATAAPRAALTRAGTSASMLYAAARGSGGWPVDALGSPSFVLRVAAAARGEPLPLTVSARGSSVQATGARFGGVVALTWSAGVVSPPDGFPGSGGAGATALAVNVNYTIYVSPAGGFPNACASLGLVAESATTCGLARAAADCGTITVYAAPLDATHLSVPVPSGPADGSAFSFDVAVVATCDAQCWTSTSAPAGTALPADLRPQSAAYPPITVAVSAKAPGSGGGAATSSSSNAAAAVGVTIAALGLCLLGLFFARVRILSCYKAATGRADVSATDGFVRLAGSASEIHESRQLRAVALQSLLPGGGAVPHDAI